MSVEPPTAEDVARGRALGLPDACDFTLLHCDKPMTWRGGSTSWTGPPNLGYEMSTGRYQCDVCTAVAEIGVTEAS